MLSRLDTSLQKRLKAAINLDEVVAIAAEAGFVVTKAEVLQAQAQKTVELSDEELEGVVGGRGLVTLLVFFEACRR